MQLAKVHNSIQGSESIAEKVSEGTIENDGNTAISSLIALRNTSDFKRLKQFGYTMQPGETLLSKNKPVINNLEAMEAKLKEIQQVDSKIKNKDTDEIPWIEKLTVSTNVSAEELAKMRQNTDDANRNNYAKNHRYSSDIFREAIFCEITLASVKTAFLRLKDMGLEFSRPNDYLAEMFKSDQHMKKVKEKLMQDKRNIQISEAKKREKIAKRNKKSRQHILKLQEQGRQKNEQLRNIEKWKFERQRNETMETAEQSFDRYFNPSRRNIKSNMQGKNFILNFSKPIVPKHGKKKQQDPSSKSLRMQKKTKMRNKLNGKNQNKWNHFKK